MVCKNHMLNVEIFWLQQKVQTYLKFWAQKKYKYDENERIPNDTVQRIIEIEIVALIFKVDCSLKGS